jgi:hypothetical protein
LRLLAPIRPRIRTDDPAPVQTMARRMPARGRDHHDLGAPEFLKAQTSEQFRKYGYPRLRSNYLLLVLVLPLLLLPLLLLPLPLPPLLMLLLLLLLLMGCCLLLLRCCCCGCC